jgi:hypothetical protein
MEILTDSANLLLNAIGLGFAGALVLLAYVILRPQASVSAAQDSAPATPTEVRPVVEANERVRPRAAQPEKQKAGRAAW